MAEQFRTFPEQRAVVFGERKINGIVNWAAVIGTVTIYTAEGEVALRTASNVTRRLREYPYNDGEYNKLAIEPLSPGTFLDISIPRESTEAVSVVVADMTKEPGKFLIAREVFPPYLPPISGRGSRILSTNLSRVLYEVQQGTNGFKREA